MGTIHSLNISVKKGTVKTPRETVTITPQGIEGDAHAGDWHRQISLLALEDIDQFSKEMSREFIPGEFAENITLIGMDLEKLQIGTQLKFSTGVILEITQIGKKCHGDGCAIYKEVGVCVMPKKGLFARVIEAGQLCSGDTVAQL